jgi:hypothetical protein
MTVKNDFRLLVPSSEVNNLCPAWILVSGSEFAFIFHPCDVYVYLTRIYV